MTTELLGSDQEVHVERIDPDKDYFSELVGEGKKFRDEKALARSKAEADLHIKTLETELAAIRNDYSRVSDEYKAVPKLQELLDRFTTQQNAPQDSTLNPERTDTTATFDPSKIEELLDSKLKQRELSQKQEANVSFAMSKLEEAYGENYQQVLRNKSKELGLDTDFVNQLAKTHPSVLLRTLGVGEQARETYEAPIKSTQRNDSFAPKTQKRTWTYYENLRKADPKAYKDPKVQTQMFKDYAELGAAFEDGDFRNR